MNADEQDLGRAPYVYSYASDPSVFIGVPFSRHTPTGAS